MKFQKGTPKNPESGRKKGVPNKRSQDLHDICEAKGISPFEAMIDLAQTADREDIRFGALKEICQYLWPKKKAIEHSGEINNPFMEKPLAELEAMVVAKVKEKIKGK